MAPSVRDILLDEPVIEVERACCALCGSHEQVALFSSGDRRHPTSGVFTVVRCAACGHLYLDPRPSSASLELYYPDDYSPYHGGSGWTKRLTSALRKREARALSRRIASGGRVLEVGCAAGDLLQPLNELGFAVVGVELNPSAAAAAGANGLDVQCGTLDDVTVTDGSLDAVIMRNVIEHLADPKGNVERAHALLRPGGLIFVSTDNSASLDCRLFGEDWYGFDVPRHFNIFSGKSLGKLLADSGFGPAEVQYSLVPTHWIVSLRYRLLRRYGERSLWRLLSPKNPLLLAAFLPVTFAQKLAGNGGRMMLIAAKLAQR